MILAILLPVIIYLIALATASFRRYDIGQANVKEGLQMIVPHFLITLPFGPIMEEWGWEG